MSGRMTAATTLTLVSGTPENKSVEEFSGPAVRCGTILTDGDWIKMIWASPEKDQATAFHAAASAAAAVPHGQFVPLGSSFAGNVAQLHIVDTSANQVEKVIPVAATRMILEESPQASAEPAGTPRPVKKLTAWTDMSLMTPEEKADWESVQKKA
jgi:hypothetical protein